MSKKLKFPLENRADGEGKLARRRNIKSASFDSEIYTTEYVDDLCARIETLNLLFVNG